MQSFSIVEAKTHWDQILVHVKSGETVTILENNRPIAQIVPDEMISDLMDSLVEDAIIADPITGPLAVERFLQLPTVQTASPNTLSSAIIEERRSGH